MKSEIRWNLQVSEICKWVKSTSSLNLQVGETRAQSIVKIDFCLRDPLPCATLVYKNGRVV